MIASNQKNASKSSVEKEDKSECEVKPQENEDLPKEIPEIKPKTKKSKTNKPATQRVSASTVIEE